MNHRRTYSLQSAAPCFLLALLTACGGTTSRFVDDDGDGWFTQAENTRTFLCVNSVTLSNVSDFRVVLDDVRQGLDAQSNSMDRLFPGRGPTIPVNIPGTCMKRVHGRNLLNDPNATTVRYRSRVTVEMPQALAGDLVLGPANVDYTSAGGQTLTVTLGTPPGPTATVVLSTRSEKFSDPSPTNAAGDADGDGITESDEFVLADQFLGLGDPTPMPDARDIVLIVGHTQPQLAPDPFTRQMLRTRFALNRIALHWDDGVLNGNRGVGGLMMLGGAPVPPGTIVPVMTATTIRNASLPAARRRFAYFAVLADSVSTTPYTFGLSSAIPGNTLTMQAVIAGTTPNILNYQAGVLMHELGHLLGLCHPTLHDGMTCTAIPVAERSPGGTVMGSPADSIAAGGAGTVIPDILSRPLNYSPAQWTLVRAGAGLAP